MNLDFSKCKTEEDVKAVYLNASKDLEVIKQVKDKIEELNKEVKA